MISTIPSSYTPWVSFEYTRDGEELTTKTGDTVLFPLQPTQRGMLYQEKGITIMPSSSSSYVADMPQDGAFFELISVTYPK